MSDRFQTYFELMPCYVTVHDRDFIITEGNQRFRADFGDRIGEPCYQVYKGREEICANCTVEKTFADGLSHSSEQLLVTREGVETPVMVHTRPIRDGNGEVVSVIEMATDIRKVKELEQELQQSQRRLGRLFEMVPCFLSVQGSDLVIQHANRAFRETFGDAVGDHCYRIYKHRQEPCLVCPVQRVLEDGKTRNHEEVVTTADGRRLNVLCVTAPIYDSKGERVSVIEMATDITEIRQLQDQLTSIGLLVGSISHGIKGLLTGLDGGIYLVNSGFAKNDDDRVTRGWQMVQRNVGRIRSMVLDILYYAKDRDLDVEDIEVDTLMKELGEILEKKARDIDVELSIEAAPNVGSFAGDAKAVRAMLLNILENSLEACRNDGNKPAHRVRFAARSASPWVVFEVEDNGIGMDRETREKIFSLFFSSKGIAGTGLGLFISNKIVDKHGGTIDVDSQPGRGTRFLIRLPREARPSTRPGKDELGEPVPDFEAEAGEP